MSRPLLMSGLDRPVEWQWLDPTAEKVKGLVEFVLPRGRVRDLLHGKAVGHPAHPPLAKQCWPAGPALLCSASPSWSGGPEVVMTPALDHS